MIVRMIIFLLLNFGALAIGSHFTSPGVASEWYQNLNQAPWTPPGWVFGVAWTTIMICYSMYMALLWDKVEDKNFMLSLYAWQWVLNVLWNPIFFYLQQVALGVIVISVLGITVFIFLFYFWDRLKQKSFLLLPYCIWIVIATSLNVYVWAMN